MENAQITESVQTVSTFVEDIPVRVHSRFDKRGRELQCDNKQDVSQDILQDVPDLASYLGVEPTAENAPEIISADSTSADGDNSDNTVSSGNDSTNMVAVAAQSKPDGSTPVQDPVQSCETFDASPVEDEPAVQPVSSHRNIVGADDRVSKRDLVSLLEGFVRIIKTDDSGNAIAGTTAPTGTGIELSRGGLTVNEARVDDRTVEIDQLRGLVIEAQDTIIKLLTDRVEDRSRIATLEAQLSLLPDLQAQADRAMSVAVRTEEYRTELTKIKFELDRFRLFRVRIEGEQKKGSVFNRIQKWLFSRPNAPDRTLQPNNYQKTVDSKIEPAGGNNG